MDWQGLAAVLGVPLAAGATVWAIVRERSRLRVLEGLVATRAGMADGSRAQKLADSFIEDVTEEIYFRRLKPLRLQTVRIMLAASLVLMLIGGFGEEISGVEFSTMQSPVFSVLCMGTSLILLIAGTLATRKMHRILGSADTRKFVDDAVTAEGSHRVLIRFGE